MRHVSKLTIFILMALFNFLFGCKNIQTSNSSKPLEEIRSHADTDGFCDISLKIVDDISTDSSHIYTVKGLSNGNEIGLKVEIEKGIPAGILQSGKISKDAFVCKGVRLGTIGIASDKLVQAMSLLYKYPTSKAFTKDEIVTTVFSLNEQDVDFKEGAKYKFKLFFEENSENLYAEMFLNLNLEKKVIELSEKDVDYRGNIIKALTK